MSQSRIVQARMPNNSQRIAIVGKTGSGKTFAAMWHLSLRDFDRRPWVIFDFKGDELINGIENAIHINSDEIDSFSLDKKSKGIYIVHPLPHQEEEVEKLLWRLWEREDVGIYVDEGYMINNDAFNAILTQGRSKRIPVIVLSQRPVWMSRFVFSEADFYQVFSLNDARDKKTIAQFTPINFASGLNPYHSFYYDVGRDVLNIFKPVPEADKILESINSRLEKRRRFV